MTIHEHHFTSAELEFCTNIAMGITHYGGLWFSMQPNNVGIYLGCNDLDGSGMCDPVEIARRAGVNLVERKSRYYPIPSSSQLGSGRINFREFL